MNVVLIYCHPCPESYTAAVRDVVLATVRDEGCTTHLLDLYADGFDPLMRADERRRYHDVPQNLAPIRAYAEQIRWADTLLFVYPTWWFGLPAMLKGWLERVFVPGLAFRMPTARRGPRPGLVNIKRFGVFTTCGASRLETFLVGAPGRRMMMRGVRSVCHPLARVTYLALYRMDSAPEAARRAHLCVVARRVRALVR